MFIGHFALAFAAKRAAPLTTSGSTKLGLELWSSRPATIIVEAVMLAVGVTIYAMTTVARDRIGAYGVGPPPPSVAAIPWAAQAMWLIVAVAYWIDRHRTVKVGA